MKKIKNQSSVKLGVVMVHRGFNAHKMNGNRFDYVVGLDWLIKHSPVEISAVQVPLFPDHLREGKGLAKTKRLFKELRKRVRYVVPVLMLTTNPLDPKNKSEAIETLRNGLVQSGELGSEVCAATSFEAWLDGTINGIKPLKGKKLRKAIDLLVDIHVSAIHAAYQERCGVQRLDMEYLRPGEFITFTNMRIALRVIGEINRKLQCGFICRLLDDTAHAKDSGLSMKDQNKVRGICSCSDNHHIGTCHASEPTTRGALGSGGSAVVQGIRSMYRHGNPRTLMVEIFDCEGEETAPMRQYIKGYGKKTYRDINVAVVEGLILVQNTLNQLAGERNLLD